MKKLLSMTAGILLLALPAAAQQMQQADTLYSQHKYTDALKIYQTLSASQQGADLYKAQLRTVACQSNLGQYLAAAETAYSLPWPANNLWKARVLLYRIQTAKDVQTFLTPSRPSYYRKSDLISAAAPQTPQTGLTSQDWQARINADFETLWAQRETLLNDPLEKETLILNVKDTDTERIPTLLDFTVNLWKKDLTSSPSVMPLLRAENFVTSDFKTPAQAQTDLEKLAVILQTAADLDGHNRADAKLFWQTDRILMPFDYPQYFNFSDEKTTKAEAIRLLNVLSGYTAPQKSFFSKIKGFVLPKHADYGRAYAAYRAAGLLNDLEDYSEAVKVCSYAQDKLGDNYYVESCKALSDSIQAPVLDVKNSPANQNPSALQLKLNTRNVDNVYVRLYTTTPAQLKKMYMDQPDVRILNSWRYLSYLSDDNIQTVLSKQTPQKQLTGAVQYLKPHAFKDINLPLPKLENGLYIALVSQDGSFNPKTAPVKSIILNNTHLAVAATSAIEANPNDFTLTLGAKPVTRNPNIFRVYTLNLETGESVPNAALEMFTSWEGATQKAETDNNGLLQLARKITVSEEKSPSYQISPFASKDGNYAFMNDAVYFHFYPQTPVKLFLDTDRAIYRPGQTVQFSLNAFQTAALGLKTIPSGTLSVTIRDVNYKQIYSTDLKLNAFGTAKDSFVLPDETLLGQYSMQAQFKAFGRIYSTYQQFQVDDYKLPEYEVALASAQNAPEYGKELSIDGNAQYYFGAPLQKATVKYTVNRVYFIPRFCWWWDFSFSPKTEYITAGQTQTDDKGNFKILFTPETAKGQSLPARYTVEAEVSDASGRVIKTQNNYLVAAKPHYFQVEFTQGFYAALATAPLATVALTDINSTPLDGRVTAEIYELEAVPASSDNATLQAAFKASKEIKKVHSQELDFKNGEKRTVQLPALPEGVYRLTLKNAKADTQELVFVVASDNPKLNLPEVTLFERDTYYPGNTAKALIGAGTLKGPKFVETYMRGQFLFGAATIGSGVSVYTFPVTQLSRGGISLRWFGASDYQLYQGNSSFQVPFDNKRLNLKVNAPATLKPGEKVTWTLSAQDATGAGVQGQASVNVYDKALDYYAQKQSPFGLDRLFPAFSANTSMSSSLFEVYSSELDKTDHKTNRLQMPALPTLNLMSQISAYGFDSFGVRGAAPRAVTMKSMNSMAYTESASLDLAVEQGAATAGGASDEKEPVQLRTDFSQTAYFNPQIPLIGGKGSASFTMPQSLTTWNISAFALTRTADFGDYTAQTITRKDFMLRLQLPRFYREGDKTALTAALNNLTAKKLTAEVELTLNLDEKNVNTSFGLGKTKKTVTVPANGSAQVSWDITVPPGVGILTITAVARAGKDSDGEAKQLPLLPSRERLLATTNVAVQDGNYTLSLPELQKPDASREVSTVALQLDPSLLLSVINAMPALLQPAYNDITSLTNRYVPLAVLNSLYKRYPDLQKALALLPERKTVTPAWDDTDPLRLTLLQNTPWLNIAQGNGNVAQNALNLFNASAVKKQQKKMEQAVAKYQNPTGAFTWMPGGPDSDYLTLYVLDSYAQALRYGAEIPQNNAKKALSFVTKRIEQNLKDDKTPNTATVAYALYSAYVLSAFPSEWKEVKAAKPLIQKWVDYADKYVQFMTPLGQNYAATVYHRLGDEAKAQSYLDLVLLQLKDNALTGAYFAPEAQSWMWYNDTLFTQTTALRTLLELRPKDPRAAKLAQWLLFNRQGNQWDSTTATAQAVFALVDYMQVQGLLNSDATYTLNWGPLNKTQIFKPFEFSQKLSFVQTAENVSPQFFTASVSKTGGLPGFAALSAVYTTSNAQASPKGVLNVERAYFLQYLENGETKLKPLSGSSEVKPTDQVQVQLTVTADSAFDYVLLKDPKPAGFESDVLLSGWEWNQLPLYRENTDSATNFFINAVPAGTYMLSYTLRPTVQGQFNVLPAQIQSMYAPQFGAHSGAAQFAVK